MHNFLAFVFVFGFGFSPLELLVNRLYMCCGLSFSPSLDEKWVKNPIAKIG